MKHLFKQLLLHRKYFYWKTNDCKHITFCFRRDVESGFTGPCGSCRQTIAEFGLDIDVYLVSPTNESKVYKLRDLLPVAFTPKDLKKPRTTHDVTN